MRISLGSDHAGFEEKQSLMDYLQDQGHDVIDLGPNSGDRVDYPDFAEKVAQSLQRGQAEKGILICGTGIGMCMAANKFRGVRAAVIHDKYTAEMSRAHNDANVLCLGSRVLSFEKIRDLATVWLNTPFEGGRHAHRVEKIAELEKSDNA